MGGCSTFCIKMPFGIGHPHLHINCSLHVCKRVQGSQIFKQNSIISICSKVMAFLMISLSPWSPRCPHGPHIVPIIPVSSPCHPGCPHSPKKVPMWSPRSVVSVVSTCCPRGPHVVPVIPTLSRRSPHHPQPPDTHSTHPLPPWGVGGLNQ